VRTGVRMYGIGGQGIITLAKLIGEAEVEDGKYVIMTEEYSPYVTGGWSKADLVIADEDPDYPLPEKIDFLITLSQEGFDTNFRSIDDSSRIIVEKELVSVPENVKHRTLEVPAMEIAKTLKNPRGANMVMMGAFAGLTKIFSKDSAKKVISRRFPNYVDVNLKCFEAGYERGDSFGR